MCRVLSATFMWTCHDGRTMCWFRWSWLMVSKLAFLRWTNVMSADSHSGCYDVDCMWMLRCRLQYVVTHALRKHNMICAAWNVVMHYAHRCWLVNWRTGAWCAICSACGVHCDGVWAQCWMILVTGLVVGSPTRYWCVHVGQFGCLWVCMRSGCPVMFDVLASVVLACEIVAEFVVAVEPELIRPGCMSAVRHNNDA